MITILNDSPMCHCFPFLSPQQRTSLEEKLKNSAIQRKVGFEVQSAPPLSRLSPEYRSSFRATLRWLPQEDCLCEGE